MKLWAWIKGWFAKPAPPTSVPVVDLAVEEVDTACRLKPILRGILTKT